MHFIDVAQGSVFETIASFILAERLGYLEQEDLVNLREQADKLGRKLNSFKRTLSEAISDKR